MNFWLRLPIRLKGFKKYRFSHVSSGPFRLSLPWFRLGTGMGLNMTIAKKLSHSHNCSRSDCAVFDVEFLDRNTFGDLDLRAEIIGLFQGQVELLLQNLQRPIDQTAWNYLTHTLKGAAAAVGAEQLAALAAKWGEGGVPMTEEQRRAFAQELSEKLAAFNAAVAQLA
jgi:hypothetical protein